MPQSVQVFATFCQLYVLHWTKLLAVRIASAELEAAQPVGVEILLAVAAQRELVALAVLEVVHDRPEVPVVRVPSPPVD